MNSNIIDFNAVKKTREVLGDDSLLIAGEYIDQMTVALSWGKDMIKTIETPNGFFNNYDSKLYTVINSVYTSMGQSIDDFLIKYKTINENNLINYVTSHIDLDEVMFNYDRKKHNYTFELYYKDILIATMIFPYKVAYLCLDDELGKYENMILDIKNLLEIREYQLNQYSKNILFKIIKKTEINMVKSKIKSLKDDLILVEQELDNTKNILNSQEFKMILSKLKSFLIKHSVKLEEI